MGLKLERHTPFLFFACAALLPAYGDTAWQALGARVPGRVAVGLRVAGLAAAVAAMVHFGSPPLKQYGIFDAGLQEWQYPVAEAAFVREHDLPGNLYNTYGPAGYLMWTLYPEHLVFWDGRQTDDGMFREGLRVSLAKKGWQGILDRYGVSTVVMEACSQTDGSRFPLLDRLQASPQWQAVYAGEAYVVFVRVAAVDADWLMRYRVGGEAVDETVLSAARHISRNSPLRRQAFWEMARIQMRQRRYEEAYRNLSTYMAVTSAGQRVPEAEGYYRLLATMVNR